MIKPEFRTRTLRPYYLPLRSRHSLLTTKEREQTRVIQILTVHLNESNMSDKQYIMRHKTKRSTKITALKHKRPYKAIEKIQIHHRKSERGQEQCT